MSSEKCSDARHGTVCRASFTVEASLLMGIILFALVSLIYAGFYLHDSAAAQAAVCELCASGANHSLEKNGENMLENLRSSLQAKGWTGASGRELSASMGEDTVQASFSGTVRVPGAAAFLPEGELQIRKTWTHRILKPADLIRKVRGLKALIGRLEGAGGDVQSDGKAG